jgi:3-deoxy-7-phosphoheptulonate synthase
MIEIVTPAGSADRGDGETTTDAWMPGTWRSYPADFQPAYPDPERLDQVLQALGRLPQLVASSETETLKRSLAEVAAGNALLLQGGDCAETFDSAEAGEVAARRNLLLELAEVLGLALERPVVVVGRIAGQYAKPRTASEETRDDVTLPAYYGDLINRPDFTAEARAPDPELLLRGYERAALALHALRHLESESAQVSVPAVPACFRDDPLRLRLASLATRHGEPIPVPAGGQLFTSHEALHLGFEEAVSHRVNDRWFNGSTHLPWIGMRTAVAGGGHAVYASGIANPIGIKLGPAMTPKILMDLLEQVDPHREPGRLVLIHRLGTDSPRELLADLIRAVRDGDREVVWICDPMHGNTETLAGGRKTRRMDRMLAELQLAVEVHAEQGSHLGGLHLELTPLPVSECLGGLAGITEAQLEGGYTSRLDPRLNPDQALEFVLRASDHLMG